MKYFYMIANYDKDYVRETEKLARSYLESRGAVCFGGEDMCRGKNGFRRNSSQVPQETECLVTIGGDGTLIQAARDLAGRNIPMVGINRGHLGFLNQVSRQEDIEPVLEDLLADRFQLEERMMIQGRVFRQGDLVMEDIALNEIAVTRKDALKALRFCVYINEEYLCEYSADGILAATPTGSTAYNLSAGGPVMAPSGKMMVLTPICPHALNVRSIVLDHKDQVRVQMLGDGQLVSFDGDSYEELKAGDNLWIESSQVHTVMIKLKQISFMQNLSNHLSGKDSGSAQNGRR